MSGPLFLGLDVGTQSVRAAFYDADGVCHGFAAAALDTTHPQPGWAEQNPTQWWSAAAAAVRQALEKTKAPAKAVAGIGLDCTACTVLPCAADGAPVRAALLWMDQRAWKEADDIGATGNPSLRWVSGVVSPEWMLPKALWLKRNEPKSYRQADRIIECTDWFMHRLTGEWTLSLNHVAVKWNYVAPEGGWDAALLKQIGLDDLPDKWPADIVPLGKGRGRLCDTAATELGLSVGLPIAQGGIDAYLGMIGLGAVSPGDLAMIMGSSTCHLAVTDRPLLGSGMLGCYADAIEPGEFVLEGGQTSTGSILNWYREHLAGNEVAEADRTGENVYEILDAKAAEVPPGCDGLVCLDYWQGNRCPRKDPRARGVFSGLSLSHGPGHLFRSIYEGTALGTRHILEDVAGHGLQIKRIFAGGGGAKSDLWLQIHADALGQPIYLPRETETCALGSALIAAVHAGHFPSVAQAAKAMVKIDKVIEPSAKNKVAYDNLYTIYLATYPALRELMR